jgi:hypothetical protein
VLGIDPKFAELVSMTSSGPCFTIPLPEKSNPQQIPNTITKNRKYFMVDGNIVVIVESW